MFSVNFSFVCLFVQVKTLAAEQSRLSVSCTELESRCAALVSSAQTKAVLHTFTLTLLLTLTGELCE